MATSLRCIHPPSGASVFVQLACRAAPIAPTSMAPILSVLIPRWSVKPTVTNTGATRSYSRETLSSREPAAQRFVRRSLTYQHQQQQTRAFTASATRRQTRCVYNSQTDEEGQEMKLEITERAGKRLEAIMKKDKNPNLALRIQVESGGCHGFQYLMSLVTLPETENAEDWSQVVGEDDTVFQYLPDGAETADNGSASFGGPKVVIDQASLDLLKGSKVDFTTELIGSQFKITDNPYATSSCGCGTSFDIKF